MEKSGKRDTEEARRFQPPGSLGRDDPSRCWPICFHGFQINPFQQPHIPIGTTLSSYKLLGQRNTAARTPMIELYMVWCARCGRRLHLGFWTAYQCHLIATHPARNLSLCNIPGAFVCNNIIITEADDLSPMYMVDSPDLFDIAFFVRTNIVYYREGVP